MTLFWWKFLCPKHTECVWFPSGKLSIDTVLSDIDVSKSKSTIDKNYCSRSDDKPLKYGFKYLNCWKLLYKRWYYHNHYLGYFTLFVTTSNSMWLVTVCGILYVTRCSDRSYHMWQIMDHYLWSVYLFNVFTLKTGLDLWTPWDYSFRDAKLDQFWLSASVTPAY